MDQGRPDTAAKYRTAQTGLVCAAAARGQVRIQRRWLPWSQQRAFFQRATLSGSLLLFVPDQETGGEKSIFIHRFPSSSPKNRTSRAAIRPPDPRVSERRGAIQADYGRQWICPIQGAKK